MSADAVAVVGACAITGVGDDDVATPRARKTMSRGAVLAAACLRRLLGQVGWDADRAAIGYYLGVGASGGSMDDLTAILRESLSPGGLDLARFGGPGLAACNPLLAFQLMNNFTLCHGAILEGVGGPSGAFFSRGTGTTVALLEAVHAIREGACARALAGGADSAHHPVTAAELARDGHVEAGLVPGEGAALLALAPATAAAADAPVVAWCGVRSTHGRGLADAAREIVASPDAAGIDVAVVAGWGPRPATTLRRVLGSVPCVDESAATGGALAAAPALAWARAVELVRGRQARRALVLTSGLDGELGAVVLARGGAA